MAPPPTFARFLSAVMPGDLIISCMAGVSRYFDNIGHRPAVIEWAGEGPPGSHPSWVEPAAKLRDPVTKELLPRLFGMFRAGSPTRVAVFGFSAGSNSGIRELLRNPNDRARISFAACVDGLHPVKNWNDSGVADFNLQVAPFANYALSASKGTGTIVFTGNNLESPTPTTYRTPQTMQLINRYVVEQLGGPDAVASHPTDMTRIRSFLADGEPTPNGVGGIGNAYFFEYPGTQKEDHITQANVIVPRIIERFLTPVWGGVP